MFLKRETPLARCPRLECRRIGRCQDKMPNFYCSKYFKTADEVRMDLTAKLEAMRTPEDNARYERLVAEGKIDPNDKSWQRQLYDALQERLAQLKQEEKAARAKAGLKPLTFAQRQKMLLERIRVEIPPGDLPEPRRQDLSRIRQDGKPRRQRRAKRASPSPALPAWEKVPEERMRALPADTEHADE